MKVCPTCHRPVGAAKRTCFACRRPILQRHKWHVEGCYIVHDDCQNPTMRTLVPFDQPSPQPEPLLASANRDEDREEQS